MVYFKWGGIETHLIKLCMLPGTTPYLPGEPIEVFWGPGIIEDLRHFPTNLSGQQGTIITEIVLNI